ncbi:DUF3368 domain-containing protein [Luteolibacter sp. Populi]|uniref:DUF3368 domain-containing protein n=1 Tax=Luteolibacter sp. Populi TaxID=3230487 RepID=UPI003465462B
MAALPFQLFPLVIVPAEVQQELLAKGSPDQGQLEMALKNARIHPSSNTPDPLLNSELDGGEASVISTALELGISALILDERKARRIASMVYGLQCKGTAGLLVEAKSRGLIGAVKPCLEGMIQGGYFLGPALVAACLSAAGES